MKVYKSRIMGMVAKNAVKARKFKRGTIDRYGSAGAFFEIERGKVTFVQGKYALESNISTAVSNDAEPTNRAHKLVWKRAGRERASSGDE